MIVSRWKNKEENEVTKVVAQRWKILKRFLIDGRTDENDAMLHEAIQRPIASF